jgi:hypothetical protein
MRRFVSIALVSLVPALAWAGPGYQFSSFTVLPQNVDKVVSAYDAFYASSAGKQFKGRASLLQNVADGSDPASHSFVALFHSQAEYETYVNAAANDPARKALLDTVVPIAQLVMTGRTSTVRSWGDVVDTDRVWVNIALNISNLNAWNAALDTWLASPKGKAFPGQGWLSAITFGGANAPTHMVSLGYASAAEMEAYVDTLAGDPDYAKFQAAAAGAGVRMGTTMSREVKTWGPAPMKSFAP